MLRELRRFLVRDAMGHETMISEVALFSIVGSTEVMDGVPSYFTAFGSEVAAGDAAGEFWVGGELATIVSN